MWYLVFMIDPFLQAFQTYMRANTAYARLVSRLTQQPGTHAAEGLEGFPLAWALHDLQKQLQRTLVVAASGSDELKALARDLELLGEQPVMVLSNGQSAQAFYEGDYFTQPEQIAGIYGIRNRKSGIVLTTLRALGMPVMGLDRLTAQELTLTRESGIDLNHTADILSDFGYERVPKTTVHGEWSLRGEILDIFIPESEQPVRLVCGWDIIESIRPFDPLTQMPAAEAFEAVTVYPWAIEQGDRSFGHLSDLFSDEEQLVLMGTTALDHGWQSIEKEAADAYRQAYARRLDPLRPEEILQSLENFTGQFSRVLALRDIKSTGPKREEHEVFSLQQARSFFGNMHYFQEEMRNMLDAGYGVYIFCGSSQQLQRISYLLRDLPVTFVEEDISAGFTAADGKLAAVTENEIFGRKKRYKRSLKHVSSSPLDSFVELNPGDFIVHIEYGVGRFLQIERIQAAGKERDYIKIEYAKGETIFIPIEQVNLLQKYIGQDGKAPSLDVIGGTSWENKKKRVKKSVEDLAEKLIALYAQREKRRGFPFPKDTDLQIAFEASFPFEETEDQLACIADVKADMEKSEPMDRLICGDVGFGKTEVALRAAFKAVSASKQVAFLAPTTILAEQHYQTMAERNKGFPISVAMLSRLVDQKDQREIIRRLNEGEIDILVGTHRILQKDIAFKNLGLLITDEEQRFGVKDKERIKELKVYVDSLSLSATPIPRTLYMSLLKIRNMSLLTTPPLQRLPIQTVIHEFDEELLRDAVLHEVERGGQVFFLHNRVRTLQKIVMTLQKLLPEVSIDYAHGKMAGHRIEDAMRRFVHGEFQVLVSTTIIENGIDIPNVNTIIIDRADNYGISQLYQLRGRVGRSDQQAYAYLFYPRDRALSEPAMKRLKIISEHTELGSGFRIAMRDMEVRGTGNLLGREQHGQMASVGLDMYLNMLDRAVAELQDQQPSQPQEMILDLDYSGFIPDTYIDDPSSKFELYRNIASISTDEKLQRITGQLEQTYGPVPDEVANLLYIAELRIIGRKLSIASLRERQGRVRIEFSKVADISVEKVLSLITESGGKVRLDPEHPQVLLMNTTAISLKDKSLFILEQLQRLL